MTKELVKKSPLKWGIYLVLTVATLLLMVGAAFYWHYGVTVIEIDVWEIASPKIPAEFNDYRIGVVGDLHGDPFYIAEDIKDKLAEANPDIIVVVGDLIYRFEPDYKLIIDILDSFATIAPVYVILGNHDICIENGQALRYDLWLSNTTFLDDSSVQIVRGDGILNIFGSDRVFEGNEDNIDMPLLEKTFQAEGYNIFLTHWPDSPEYLSEDAQKYDLQISGHYHGGQLRFLGEISPYAWLKHLPQEGVDGVISLADSDIAVTRGTGVGKIPVRLFCQPQVMVLILQHAEQRQVQKL